MEAETRRARELLVWKETKMYEMERKTLEWQHAFAKDERERSRQVKQFR